MTTETPPGHPDCPHCHGAGSFLCIPQEGEPFDAMCGNCSERPRMMNIHMNVAAHGLATGACIAYAGIAVSEHGWGFAVLPIIAVGLMLESGIRCIWEARP